MGKHKNTSRVRTRHDRDNSGNGVGSGSGVSDDQAKDRSGHGREKREWMGGPPHLKSS